MSPKNQERTFKKEYARELLSIAEGDLGSGRVLFQNFGQEKSRAENVFFLCQQAIEKALKAVLCAYGLPVPLVHELGVLVSKLPDESAPHFGYELGALTEFAATRRYEEGVLVLTREEAGDVVQNAEKILEWAEDQISTQLG